MEKIFTEIRDNVEKEVDQLLSRAKRVAEREVKYARIEAEKILSEHNFEIQKQANLLEEREKSHNSLDKRQLDLAQRHTVLEEISQYRKKKNLLNISVDINKYFERISSQGCLMVEQENGLDDYVHDLRKDIFDRFMKLKERILE